MKNKPQQKKQSAKMSISSSSQIFPLSSKPQNKKGSYNKFCHLLSLEDLSKQQIENILDRANPYAQALSATSRGKKIKYPILSGRLVMNLFFEPSTRTLSTFAIAATRLSADVQSLNVASSSTTKGETILDTVANLTAMGADYFVIRHQQSGAAKFVADFINENYGGKVHIVNAGDGCNSHPTQGLLDLYTIRSLIGHKKDFSKLSVAIVGDVLHSRVARSDIIGLQKLGVKDLRIIAPGTLIPPQINTWAQDGANITISHNFEQAISGVDVIIMLRLQNERMDAQFLPSASEYFKFYGLTAKRLALAKPSALVMHPGPINRGVEIAPDVADGEQSVILSQVTNGIAVRMAVLTLLNEGENEHNK